MLGLSYVEAVYLRRRWVVALVIVTACAVLGSYYAALSGVLATRPAAGRYFLVDVQGEKFVIKVTDGEAVRLAEERMMGLNRMFPLGELARGDGGFNMPWSWHLKPESVRMVDASIELCDGLPSHVESDLDYWVDVVGQYCPWSAEIVASADEPRDLHK